MIDMLITILNMSLKSIWLILAVIILRAMFKAAPKRLRLVMWLFVALRLTLPFSFKSILSLLPFSSIIPKDIALSQTPHINSSIPFIREAVNALLENKFTTDPSYSVNKLQVVFTVLCAVYITGVFAMVLYTLISSLRIKKSVKTAKEYEDGYFMSENIDTPFIFGLIKPRIYLPTDINSEDMSYVISHERQHIKGLDHIFKVLGFIVLSVHWFNPAVWLCYRLFCEDMELSCDERVIREMGEENKKSYANALINCSAQKRPSSPCPVAFGEISVKSRVKAILKYKRSSTVIAVLMVILCLVAAVCFGSDPIKDGTQQSVETSLNVNCS